MRSVKTQPSATMNFAPSSTHAMSRSSSLSRNGPVHLTASRSPLLLQEKLPSLRLTDCDTSNPKPAGGAGGAGTPGAPGGACAAGGAGAAGAGGAPGAASAMGAAGAGAGSGANQKPAGGAR